MSEQNEIPPISVNASPATDQAASAVRTLLLVVSVGTALAGFLSKRDLAGFIAYAQSSDFLSIVALLVGGATFAWGQWKTRHRAKQLATIAADPRTPDSVAMIKGATTERAEP